MENAPKLLRRLGLVDRMKDLGAFVVFLLFIYDTWILHSTTKQINCDFFVIVFAPKVLESLIMET